MSLVESESHDVSTAHSEQFEEFKSVFDAQQRLDGMQLEEDDDGEESLVEMTAMDEVSTGAVSSISIASTGYTGSATMEYSSMEDLTDELNSIYSDNEKSELEVECPTYFYVSSEGKAVAMDSIEALDKLADFMPIPVDFTGVTFNSLDHPKYYEKESIQSMVEYTCITTRTGDIDSTTTCPIEDYRKDAAITERADITSYCLSPSQTDVTVAAVDEGLVENEDYSVAADMTVYSVPKSERDVDISEVSVDYCTVYSYEASDVERSVELDTHTSYTEGPSEVECNL